MFESSLTEYTTDELFELFMCTILMTISSSRISINVSLDNTFNGNELLAPVAVVYVQY